MGKVRLKLALVAAAACSAPSDPDFGPGLWESLRAGESQLFVLGMLENQRSDAIITFDQQCAGVHIQSIVRDSIELHPDSSAKRTIRREERENGQLVDLVVAESHGKWRSGSGPRGNSRLFLDLTNPVGTEFTLSLEVRSDNTLELAMEVFGSCAGPNIGSRMADGIFTRR